MKNLIKEYKHLKEENEQLKKDVNCLNSQLDNMMKFSLSFKEFYNDLKSPIFHIGSRGIQTLTQTYTINPYDNTPIEFIKQKMCRELSDSLTNYIDLDVKDDPMGHKVLVAKISVLDKGAQ